jgi:hypothetical protein
LTPYKRSIFLINPPFQLRFSLIVSSVILISTLIYPVIILDFFSLISKRIPSLAAEIAEVQSDLILYLVLIQFVLALLVFLSFIFFTHKIAGPLYKLRIHLEGIREGKTITPLIFRNGDYFQEIADEVTLFLESVRVKQERDFEQVEDVVQYLDNIATVVPEDKKPVMSEISRQLTEIRDRYKSTL